MRRTIILAYVRVSEARDQIAEDFGCYNGTRPHSSPNGRRSIGPIPIRHRQSRRHNPGRCSPRKPERYERQTDVSRNYVG